MIPKRLQKIKSGWVPCKPKPDLYAPDLGRPIKSYDDDIDPPRICPEETCPPRMDDNLAVPDKKLKKFIAGDCPPCQSDIPTEAPPLRRPRRLYKDYDPVRICPQPEPCKRMDDDLKVETVFLPDLGPPGCIVGDTFKPTICPKVIRLRPRVLKRDRVPCDPEPECNVDPPRLDDVCCVQVKKKNLPAFNPKYYPQDYNFDYCYEEPFDLGKVCCIPPKPKHKSVFLPEKKKKVQDMTCACEPAWGIDGEMEK